MPFDFKKQNKREGSDIDDYLQRDRHSDNDYMTSYDEYGGFSEKPKIKKRKNAPWDIYDDSYESNLIESPYKKRSLRSGSNWLSSIPVGLILKILCVIAVAAAIFVYRYDIMFFIREVISVVITCVIVLAILRYILFGRRRR